MHKFKKDQLDTAELEDKIEIHAWSRRQERNVLAPKNCAHITAVQQKKKIYVSLVANSQEP